jgi:hypothetical protein
VRRALLLPALALVVAGCGETYSEADVHRALGPVAGVDAPRYPKPASTFATLAAVTDLLIVSPAAPPRRVYGTGRVTVELFDTPHDAWSASHGGFWFAYTPDSEPRVLVERRGNLVFVGLADDVRAVLDRLH